MRRWNPRIAAWRGAAAGAVLSMLVLAIGNYAEPLGRAIGGVIGRATALAALFALVAFIHNLIAARLNKGAAPGP